MQKFYPSGPFGNQRMGRSRSFRPAQVIGAPGFVMVGGQLLHRELSRKLANREMRWRIYESIIANNATVAAGVRLYSQLISDAEWTFKPSEADTTGEFAERCARMLTEDPVTYWPHIVARIAMFRFYGFTVQEWIAKPDDEGYLTFADISVRPSHSIYGWDIDVNGTVMGAIQQNPQTQGFHYLPMGKLVYVVDDVLSSSPEGMGLLRQLVEPCQRVEKYEQLEGWGHDLDLRGIPLIRTPRAEMYGDATISEADIESAESELRDLAQNHNFNPERGIILDSAVYRASDQDQRPSQVYKWDVGIVQGQARSHAEVAAAIQRLTREIARIMSNEQLILGEGGGSFALSQDKTANFHLLINSVLHTCRKVIDDSLVGTLWNLNGWDEELRPEVGTSAVDHKDVYKMATAHRDMASAGVLLTKYDPAYRDFLAMIGSEHPDEVDDPILAELEERALMPDEPMENDPAGNAGPAMDKRREIIVVSPRVSYGKGHRYFSGNISRRKVRVAG